MALFASGQASSQRDVFSHTGQVRPLRAVGGVIAHTFFFSGRNSKCAQGVLAKSPSPPIPQVKSETKSSRASAHPHEHEAESETCCNSGLKTALWRASLIGRFLQISPMPASNMSIGVPPCVVRSMAVSRTLWDSAGKCMFLCEMRTWRLTVSPDHMHRARVPARTENCSAPWLVRFSG